MCVSSFNVFKHVDDFNQFNVMTVKRIIVTFKTKQNKIGGGEINAKAMTRLLMSNLNRFNIFYKQEKHLRKSYKLLNYALVDNNITLSLFF